jgi:hypothetical protein
MEFPLPRSPFPFPARARRLALAGFLAALGCTDHDPAGGVYGYDGAAHAVLVRGGLEPLHQAAREGKTAPAAASSTAPSTRRPSTA